MAALTGTGAILLWEPAQYDAALAYIGLSVGAAWVGLGLGIVLIRALS